MKFIIAAVCALMVFSSLAWAQPAKKGFPPQHQIPSTIKSYPCWSNENFVKYYLQPEEHELISIKTTKTHAHFVTRNKKGEMTYFVKNLVGDVLRTCVILRTEPGFVLQQK